MKKAFAFVISLSFLVLVLSACNNNVDDMLEDYNGGFNVGHLTVTDSDTKEYTLEPDDSGYDQKKLLFDDYTVFNIGTLNLAAPESCRSFKWTLTDPSAENPDEAITVKFFDGTRTCERVTKDYVVYMPESGLESEHTYKLTLSVTGKSGGKYSDSCLIFIVKYYVNY